MSVVACCLLLARVWGLVGTGARIFGFEQLLLALTASPVASDMQAAQQRPEVLPAPSEPLVPGAEPAITNAEVTEPSTLDTAASIIEQPVLNTAPDASDVPEVSTPEDVPVASPPPEPEVVVHAHKPEPLIFAPAVLETQPAKTRMQTRFLADVRSNVVSLLVHAPTGAHKPSDLTISVNEEQIENEASYTCEQLSSDVYLLGVEGAEEGSAVEIALD